MSTTLNDYIGHKLLGQAYPVNGNPHPARAVVATVTGVKGEGSLEVRIEEDDLVATVMVSPIFEFDLSFGATPFVGVGTGEEYDEEWEFDFDFHS